MHEKKLTMTGSCKWVKEDKLTGMELALGDGANNIIGKCSNAEASFVIKRSMDSPAVMKVPPISPIERHINKESLVLGS